MVGFFKLSRSRQLLAGAAVVAVLTIALWLAGWLGTAGRLTAYGVMLLAIAVATLAAGAMGIYAEQRDEVRQHADQLARAKIADIAQVQIDRLSGPGELVTINVRNASSRAIRNVYVWADVRGAPGHYAAGIPAQDARSRHMIYVPRDDDLHWRLRAIRPGADALFTQLTHMNPNPVPAVTDAEITAYAEFIDAEDTWWRCDEDGMVTRRPSAEPLAAGARHGGRRAPPDEPARSAPRRHEPNNGQQELLHSARFAGRVVRRAKSSYSDVP